MEKQHWPTWLGEVESDPATLLRPTAERHQPERGKLTRR
jgi:hypothetical protein